MKGFIPGKVIKFVDEKSINNIYSISLQVSLQKLQIIYVPFTNLITSISYHDRRVQALYHRNQQRAGLFATL